MPDLEDVLKDLKEALKERDVPDSRINAVIERLRALASEQGEDEALSLAELVGRVARAFADGVAGDDRELIRELLQEAGPVFQQTLGRLVDEALNTLKPPNETHVTYLHPPYRLEAIRRDWWFRRESSAPRAWKVETDAKPDCAGRDEIRIPIRVMVRMIELPVESVEVLLMGAAKLAVNESDVIVRGREGGKNRTLPEEQEEGDTWIFDMAITITCGSLFGNLGKVIAVIKVTDEDENMYIALYEMNLQHLLLDESFECCKVFRERFLEEAIRLMKKNMRSGADPELIPELIDDLLRTGQSNRSDSTADPRDKRTDNRQADSADADEDQSDTDESDAGGAGRK